MADFVSLLHEKISLQILSKLTHDELAECSSVSSRWNHICNNQYLWNRLFVENFGVDISEFPFYLQSTNDENSWKVRYQKVYKSESYRKRLEAKIWKVGVKAALHLNKAELCQFPIEIVTFEYITDLSLRRNEMSLIPREISRLKNLRSLNLSHNRLTSLPNEMCDLQRLQELKLTKNCFTTFPESILSLVGLSRLKLNDNFLKNIPEEISALEQLEELDLYNNMLVGLPRAVGMLKYLRILNLSCNDLSEIPDEMIEVGSLCEIYVYNNRIRPEKLSGEIHALPISGLLLQKHDPTISSSETHNGLSIRV